MYNEYVIIIPSNKRANKTNSSQDEFFHNSQNGFNHFWKNNKTLITLNKHKISNSIIYIYVENQKEKQIYETFLDEHLYKEIRIKEKREEIINDFEFGKHIIIMSDDIVKIDLSLSLMFKNQSLNYFIITAFNELINHNIEIFKILRNDEMIILNENDDCFYGLINKPFRKINKNSKMIQFNRISFFI